MTTVAFQGEPGAYSEAAAFGAFGPAIQTQPCASFETVFDAVQIGSCDFGILPVENSLAGSIHRNYDLLLQNTLWVVNEYFQPVHHCLMVHPGVERSQIRKVISHTQALAQCEVFLQGLTGVAIEPVYDTAGAARLVKQSGDRSLAAIASRRAAEIYGLQILAENIQSHPNNVTRFVVVGSEPADPAGEAKTSIVFALQNEPGSLFKALSVFALRNIDLTKIESRPLVGSNWEYFFYIDFIGSIHDPVCSRALAHLEEYATMLRVLGSYPRQRITAA